MNLLLNQIDDSNEPFCVNPQNGSLDYLADIMGFEYDDTLPVNCLHPDCFVEKLIIAAEEELARSGFC